MKKKALKNLQLNKRSVSDLTSANLKGGDLLWTWDQPTTFPTPTQSCADTCGTRQTGSLCLTGFGTNCQ
ncbi:hypothetical protein [Ascidiimonas aurantiaca]|uniref:hypothetical protein n=1 Tax=Ascidiimonas aurantiaca TaxID=1685432 RepID=UPI0030EBD7F4